MVEALDNWSPQTMRPPTSALFNRILLALAAVWVAASLAIGGAGLR